MPSVETALSEIAPRLLPQTILTSLQKRDPMHALFEKTSKGVSQIRSPVNLRPSGWEFRIPISLGVAGAARFVSTAGPSIRSAVQPMILLEEAQRYPGALEAIQPGYQVMTGTLAKSMGTLVTDESILRQNQAKGLAADHITHMLETAGLRSCMLEIAALHTPSSSTRHICTVSSVNVASGGATASFIPAEGNELLFFEGMAVQFFKVHTDGKIASRHSSNGRDDLSALIYVTAVDPITRRVYVATADGSNKLNITDNAVANNDIVVIHGQLQGGSYTSDNPILAPNGTPVAYGPYGLVDWFVNAGSLLGVSTDTFQRLKSFITTNLGGPITEDELDRHMTWYHRWHSKRLTHFFLTPGMYLAFRNTFMGMFTADRTGKPVRIVGGHSGTEYVFNGEPITFVISPYNRAGYGYGLNMEPGNYQMFTPPMDPSLQSGSMSYEDWSGEVEFKVNGSGAFKSIFKPVGYVPPGGGTVYTSTVYEANYVRWSQRWPVECIPGIVIANAQEDNWSPT